VVCQLKQELHEKDLRLTDIQLEALSSAHQLEQLCETMNRMKVSYYNVLLIFLFMYVTFFTRDALYASAN